ncbi:MAG: 2-C-methyl-D-erythritol 4-phosphate cytidylyltransferase [Streptococcaceae bacterium]|jgi:2-C-methyl-D-erythritol 4-phosphate cytidylyltransferase|nr:2-C-methyl-D-erythritol 4-phosphate cytidylyltransferase [Streptococcaceae bacterium]
MEYTAIVLAAGRGKRMKARDNKIFLELGGRPILSYALDVFAKDADCKQLIVVGRAKEQSMILQLSEQIEFVVGGVERQDSVKNALAKVNCDYVMIHDGARPFIKAAQLEGLKRHVEKAHATLLAVPVKDTIKQVSGEEVERTLPRNELYQAQTPQAFLTELIKDVHEKAALTQFLGTDDASLVETFSNQAVTITQGNYQNIKITTPDDLILGEAILKAGI